TCGGRRKTQPTVRDGLTTTERRASIWKAQGDSEEAWQHVLEELAETDGLEMSLGEDGVVTLTWEAGDEEGVEVVDGIELVQELDMVVQRLHEERI
ncbi:DUF1654 domain-containing protein, partial [Pseudomonas aeruginosa]